MKPAFALREYAKQRESKLQISSPRGDQQSGKKFKISINMHNLKIIFSSEILKY